MLNLTSAEMQKLVLMLGSKKALGTYLGLDTKQTSSIWIEHGLQTPLNWLRDQDRTTQLEMLASAGSLKVLAKRLAVSETALRPIYIGEPKRSLDWTVEFLLEQIGRYKSIRLVAHINDVNESLVRKCADEHNVELAELVDYSFGGNSNSKGRRAELEYAALRGDSILEDKNITEGSQANYDFDDAGLQRVNVKSSRQYSFRAMTRRESPDYWKFSTSGWQTADHLVCLCYDEKMNTLVGIYVIEAARSAHSKTITIGRSELKDPNELRTDFQP